MPELIYTQDEVDALLVQQAAASYSKDEVDALLAALKPQPPVQPAPGKILGSGDMTAFRGLKISGHRTYNGFGATRQQNPALALAQVVADQVAGRRPYFSLGASNNKAHPGGALDWPTSLTSSPTATFVPTLKAVQAAGGLGIWHHEPEDDPGTPGAFKTWFPMMSTYYRQQVPGLRVGLCLMAWTGRKGGPGFPLWTPDPASFDVLCIDGYAHQASDTADAIFGNALAYARSLKKPLMICETGQEATQDQSAWLRSVDSFVQANADIEGWLYWNGGGSVHDYRLSADALAIYSGLLGNGRYAQGGAAV